MDHSLFCKPGHAGVLCQKRFVPTGQLLSFQSFDLRRHLPEIHHWVNLPYAQPFWLMSGSMGLLQACYQCILQNPHGHSFAGMLDEALYCQLDIYRVRADELNDHLDCGEDEVGFHLIIAPPDRQRLPARGLTLAFLALFLDWYFSFPRAQVMWAEPDIRNGRSLRLLHRLGFGFVKRVQMSYKVADVYRLDRNDWQQSRQGGNPLFI